MMCPVRPIIRLLFLATTISGAYGAEPGNNLLTCKKKRFTDLQFVLATFNVRSRLECATRCSNDEKCKSVNVRRLPAGFECQTFSDTVEACDTASLADDDGTKFLTKEFAEAKCKNGEEWDETGNQCIGCKHKSWGQFCDQYYKDCHDHANKKPGEQTGADIKVLIKPQSSQEPFMVICRTNYGGQTIVAFRDRDLDENYNRGWNDYKMGFGDVDNGNFFVGLENIHNLLKVETGRLKVFHRRIGSNNGYTANYYNLRIENELNNYALHFDYFTSQNSGENGFEFGPINQRIRDAQFCTTDRDCNGCALVSQSGWWFGSGCATVNLHLPKGAVDYMKWPIGGSLTDLRYYEMIFYFTY